jgi:hypothetical protein
MGYLVRSDQDLAQQAIAVTASAEDAEYPAEKLITENPADTAKLTTNTGWWVTQYAAKVAPVAAAVIYHYLDAGLNVRLQGNDTDSWGAPAFDQAFTIPAKRKDGPSYQRWTTSPWILLDALDDEDGYLFWRLVIVGTNSQVVAVGRLVLAASLLHVTLFHDGGISESDRPENDPSRIVHPTELGVETRYTIGGPRRGLSFTLIGTDLSAGTPPTQEAADFRALAEACDGEHPFLLAPFETNDMWCVMPENVSWPRSHEPGGYQVWSLSVREESRGLPWP